MSMLSTKSWGQFRQLIIWLVVVLLLAGVLPFLWRYVRTSAVELQRVRTEDEQSQVMKERLEEIERSVADTQPAIDQIALSYPRPGAAPQVIERLERLAASKGVELDIAGIREDQPQVVEGRATVYPLSVSIDVVGQVDNLLEFLVGIEQVQELIATKEWVITQAPLPEGVDVQENPGLRRFRLNASLVFYLLDET